MTDLVDLLANGTRVFSIDSNENTATSDAPAKKKSGRVSLRERHANSHFSFFSCTLFASSKRYPSFARPRLVSSLSLTHARSRTPAHTTKSKEEAPLPFSLFTFLIDCSSSKILREKKRWPQSPPSPGWTSSEFLWFRRCVILFVSVQQSERGREVERREASASGEREEKKFARWHQKKDISKKEKINLDLLLQHTHQPPEKHQ
jgi:hypothetical protein